MSLAVIHRSFVHFSAKGFVEESRVGDLLNRDKGGAKKQACLCCLMDAKNLRASRDNL